MDNVVFVLQYSLRFAVYFLVVVLWMVAVSQIRHHGREAASTTVGLASMIAAVSVVAVGVIVALNAAFPSPVLPGGTREEIDFATRPALGCTAFTYGFTYGVGLGRPATPDDCGVGFGNPSP